MPGSTQPSASHAARERVTITLVGASDMIVERIRLHEVAAGNGPTPRQIAAWLEGNDVTFVVGRRRPRR